MLDNIKSFASMYSFAKAVLFSTFSEIWAKLSFVSDRPRITKWDNIRILLFSQEWKIQNKWQTTVTSKQKRITPALVIIYSYLIHCYNQINLGSYSSKKNNNGNLLFGFIGLLFFILYIGILNLDFGFWFELDRWHTNYKLQLPTRAIPLGNQHYIDILNT